LSRSSRAPAAPGRVRDGSRGTPGEALERRWLPAAQAQRADPVFQRYDTNGEPRERLLSLFLFLGRRPLWPAFRAAVASHGTCSAPVPGTGRCRTLPPSR